MPETDNPNAGTPAVHVFDNRGREVRRLAYNRVDPGDPLDERIERETFSAAGHPVSVIDARLFSQQSATPNFRYTCSLGGMPLRTLSVDAGAAYLLADIEGRAAWQRDGRGTVGRHDYDVLGRRCARHEQLSGSDDVVRERLIYGESIDGAAARNLCDRLARHYDGAGLLDLGQRGYSLHGEPLCEQRQLLPPGEDSAWPGDDESAWQAALEPTAYLTSRQYNACGEASLLTDTMGHQRRYAYDLDGRESASWVRLQGAAEQQVRVSIRYSATGQRLQEVAGNGATVDYAYEPQTQRLTGLRICSGTSVLQDLHYIYDPVGNVSAVTDSDESRAYVYDALYQLMQASGSENVSSGVSPVDDPVVQVPVDSAQYSTYTRGYDYDRGGNLQQIRHQGGNSHTRTLAVSSGSNRAVLVSGEPPVDVDACFDACGNLLQLDTGQSLTWNGLNQLQQLTDAAGMVECYSYGGDRHRVRKTRTLSSGEQYDVIYLPGLELRTTQTGGTQSEALQVLTAGEAGRCPVRMLNWTAGLPADMGNGQLRYSLDDYLGSSLLELDGAGTVLTRESYYPYGGTARRAAGAADAATYKTVRYSGKERDSGSELYDYGLRYYLPWQGRWLNPDPAGTVDGLNLYRMVGNNPVRWRDMDGNRAGDSLESNYRRGDVLFGLREPVWGGIDIVRSIGPTWFQRIFQRWEPVEKIIQDDLSSRIWSPFHNEGHYSSEEEIRESYKGTGEVAEGIAFRAFVMSHDRFNVLKHDKLPEYEGFRKLSKAGLEFHLKTGRTIHFFADQIIDNLNAVAGKQGTPKNMIGREHAAGLGTSITSSELRWLYRNRHTASVQENVKFYLGGREISHAEVFDRPEWNAYRPKRVLPQGFRY